MPAYTEFDAYDAVALEVKPLKERIEKLEKRMNRLSLAVLPEGYKRDERATIAVIFTGKNGTTENYRCTKCGAFIDRGDLFCRVCGRGLDGLTIGRVEDFEEIDDEKDRELFGFSGHDPEDQTRKTAES